MLTSSDRILVAHVGSLPRNEALSEVRAELYYLDTSAIGQEIDRVQGCVKELHEFRECFMATPSPGILSTTMLNSLYDSQESYLAAIAREMHKEYMAIHEAGLILQIDAPDLAMDRAMFYRDLSDADFVKACEMHVAAINQGGFRACACDCTSAGATGTGRIFTTSRWS